MSKIILAVAYLGGGGAERVVSLWADGLKAKGHDVSLVLFHRIKNEYNINPEIPVYAVAENQREYETMSPVKKYIKTRRILKDIVPDYIISFLPASQCWMMITALGMRVHRIETLRNNPKFALKHINPLFRAAWRVCFPTCRTIILQTSGQLKYFKKFLQRKCVIVPNPIAEKYVTVYNKTVSEYPTRLIAVGRICPQKNYKLMIDAFTEVSRVKPELTLNIFGEGNAEYTHEIQKYIDDKRMSEKIRLMGRISEIEKEYQKSDIFLMTSDYEGLPNALMEAMASRLICISTDCDTGPEDLIKHGETGFLVPVGDTKALSRTLIHAAEMSLESRIKMADAARNEIMTKYSLKNSINALCQCFN